MLEKVVIEVCGKTQIDYSGTKIDSFNYDETQILFYGRIIHYQFILSLRKPLLMEGVISQ